MEYEVFFGCNIIGTAVVVLIILYHLVGSVPLKSIERDEQTGEVELSFKKSQ
jgi:hypothetical protein